MSDGMQYLSVLIVDDEHVDELAQAFADGDIVCKARTLAEAVRAAKTQMPDLVILDVMFPKASGSGCEFLAGRFLEDVERLCDTEGVARPTVLLVSGQKEAASRFEQVAKWLSEGHIRDILPKSLAGNGWEFFRAVLRHRVSRLRDESVWRPIQHGMKVAQAALAKHRIITCNPSMLAIWDKISNPRWSSSPFPVLIKGETGTGKELMASAIHCVSSRARQPYVAVNITERAVNILESELFGYAPNSGIHNAEPRGQAGQFEMANGGTIFLDEIGDLPLPIQVKLLRVLQEKQIRRISATVPIELDVRVVTATHHDLRAAVEATTFREDLFYRLNFLTIDLPPLRERFEDIPLLVSYFVQQLVGNDSPVRLAPDVVHCFRCYRWPGNIRELFGAMVQIVTDAPSDERLLKLEILRNRYSKAQLPCLYPDRPVTPSPDPSPSVHPDPEADELPAWCIDRLKAGDRVMWLDLDERLVKPVKGSLARLLNPEGLSRLASLDAGVKDQTDPAPFHLCKTLLYLGLAAQTGRRTRTHEDVQSILPLSWGQADKVLMTLAGVREKKQGSKPAQHHVMDTPFLVWERTKKPPTFEVSAGLLDYSATVGGPCVDSVQPSAIRGGGDFHGRRSD